MKRYDYQREISRNVEGVGERLNVDEEGREESGIGSQTYSRSFGSGEGVLEEGSGIFRGLVGCLFKNSNRGEGPRCPGGVYRFGIRTGEGGKG
jgi:hypothetical protein